MPVEHHVITIGSATAPTSFAASSTYSALRSTPTRVRRLDPWIRILALIRERAYVLALASVLAACGGDDSAGDSAAYVGGLEACNQFRAVADNVLQGQLVDAPLEEGIRAVHSTARDAEPSLRVLSEAVVKEMALGRLDRAASTPALDYVRIVAAMIDLESACIEHGYWTERKDWPEPPVPRRSQ